MSTQLIERYYRAFNQRDYPAMLACLAPDVVHDINQAGSERGRDAFAAFLQRMDACYRERLEDVVVMGDAAGTRFAAEFSVHGTYLKADAGLPPARGQSYRLPAGAFFEVAAGLITRVTTYYNAQAWIAQVSAP
jgi:steroid delta-isomerase-like uncharacterized protein